MKRCYIYARVSTSEQNKGEFTSIENQVETCKHFIAIRQAEGWSLVKTITDPGFSGKDLERPGIKELMDEVNSGNVDVVLTYKVDRVSRSLVKFYEFYRLLETHKVEFVSATQSFDTSNSAGRLMLNILLSFAEYEREIISERTADKMYANFQRGKWGGGYAPYGYERDPKTKELHVSPKEAKAVKLMFESIASGHTLSDTARVLLKEGYSTKHRIVKRNNGKEVDIGGKKFREDIIHRLIRNPFYCGLLKHKEELGKHQYDRIIPKALYDKANDMMNRRAPKMQIVRKVDRHIHLLKGLIQCESCGCTMTPFPSGKKDENGNPYLYYTCTDVNHHKSASECKVRSFSARTFENTIIQYLKELGNNPAIINRCIDLANKGSDGDIKRLENQQKQIRKEIERVTTDIKNLIETIKKGGSPTEMAKEANRLEAEREKWKLELEKVQVESNMKKVKQFDGEMIKSNLTRFAQVVDKVSLEEKKDLMQLLIRNIRVSPLDITNAKAPTEKGAFDCKIRTSWYRVLINVFEIPYLPLTYDEQSNKFVFSSNCLREQDSNLKPLN